MEFAVGERLSQPTLDTLLFTPQAQTRTHSSYKPETLLLRGVRPPTAEPPSQEVSKYRTTVGANVQFCITFRI